MRQTTQKTINKYMEMVSNAGRVFTEQEIISLRSFLNMKLKDAPDVRQAIVNRFFESLEIVPFQLTKEQQMKGLQWLIKTQINKKGDLRNAQTTFLQQEHLDMIRNFENFEFVGLENLANSFQVNAGYMQYMPVYRLNTTDGRWFEYGLNHDRAFEVIDQNLSSRQPRKLKAV